MSAGCPPWSTHRQAWRLLVHGVTLRPAGPIALMVGSVLSAVNEGGALWAGRVGLAVAVKVGVNYLTPFVVASLGFLAAGRQPRHQRERRRSVGGSVPRR